MTPELLAQALETAARVLRGEQVVTSSAPAALPVDFLETLAAFKAKGVDAHTGRILTDLERFARDRQRTAAMTCSRCGGRKWVDIQGSGGPQTNGEPYRQTCPECCR